MNFLQAFDRWHKTKVGYAISGLVELVIAYGIGSRALDTGSAWEYFFTLFFLVGALHDFMKLIGNVFHVGNKTKTA